MKRTDIKLYSLKGLLLLSFILTLASCKTTQETVEAPKSRGIEKLQRFVKVHSYFATNRNYKIKNGSLSFGFDTSSVSYGKCEVSIPFSHKVGVIEQPSLWKMEIREDPTKHITVLGKRLLTKPNYFKSIIEGADEKTILLFIHGFNVSFDKAAMRTCQMIYDLDFAGVPIFYSWPSHNRMFRYLEDEKHMRFSESKIEQFLRDLVTKLPDHEIIVIGHSMGNRGLTSALKQLFEKNPEYSSHIKEIILSAPDIDANVFTNQIAPALTAHGNNITLYTSSSDIALKASATINAAPRIGELQDRLALLHGIEVIDATNVDTNFTGHMYFGDSKSVINDIEILLDNGLRANERETLQPFDEDHANIWKLRN